MKYNEGQIIEVEGINVCVLDVENENGLDYIYAAEIVDNDITGNFYVYKVENQNIVKVTDSVELKEILPIFIGKISKKIEEV